jgi:hypothetical protein
MNDQARTKDAASAAMPAAPMIAQIPSPQDEVTVDPRVTDLLGLTGLELLKWGIAGKSVAPPIDRLTGIQINDV